MRTAFPFRSSASLRSGMLTRTECTFVLVKSGAFKSEGSGREARRPALTLVRMRTLARTSAEAGVANFRRFAFSFACFIALLLFTAAFFAIRKSTAEARSQDAENKEFEAG